MDWRRETEISLSVFLSFVALYIRNAKLSRIWWHLVSCHFFQLLFFFFLNLVFVSAKHIGKLLRYILFFHTICILIWMFRNFHQMTICVWLIFLRSAQEQSWNITFFLLEDVLNRKILLGFAYSTKQAGRFTLLSSRPHWRSELVLWFHRSFSGITVSANIEPVCWMWHNYTRLVLN